MKINSSLFDVNHRAKSSPNALKSVIWSHEPQKLRQPEWIFLRHEKHSGFLISKRLNIKGTDLFS